MYIKPNVKRWGPAQLSPAEGISFIEKQHMSAASGNERIVCFIR